VSLSRLTANALALLVVLCAASIGRAASETVAAVQAELYAGRTTAAVAAAEARLATAPGDDEARYALGAAQLLRAVERLGQGLYGHGLAGSGEPGYAGLGVLPILRIPVPENPNPAPLTYELFRELLKAFVADLATAEATFAAIRSPDLALPLNIGLIRLDLNGNGAGSEDEALWRIFKQVAELPWLDAATADRLQTDFDASDVPWARGYCHLLMAIAEFPLAHDWRAGFDATFHGIFPRSGLPTAALNERPEAIRKGLAGGSGSADPSLIGADSVPLFAGVADLIAFVHLMHWPVVEPARMGRVLAHLEAVPRLSRENWRLILAETDDAEEWIPSPKQSGVLPGMVVTDAQVEGWMLFLDEFEGLLAGRKLLPHWRFEKGVNLRRMFLEPTTFDPVLLIQGAAALPYLEAGEMTAPETWMGIVGLFGGDFFRYALWFN